MKIPLIKNTLTNYLSMFVRLLQGILITRWMLAELGEENYGLWIMLWSFFCYSLLLDFGLGAAAQKATAAELWRRNIRKYNITISTVFFFHLAMSLIIVAGTLVAACWTRELLNLSPTQDVRYYRFCFLLFGVGSAAVFPFGVFPEILVGLQKIYLRNNITVVSKLAELAGVGIVFLAGGGLVALISFTLVLMALTQAAMAFFVKRSIPDFRIAFVCDKKLFGEIFHFSSTVYLTSIAKIIWERCSVLFISVFCGLVQVSIYQVGVRLTVLMTHLTGPYQENISPLTALLCAKNKRGKLAQILVNSMRWNSFLSTGMTIGILVFAPVLIRFLFGYEEHLATASLVCRITVVSVWFWLVFRTIPEKFLLMGGEHKFLAKASVAESVLFVLSSVAALAFYKSLYVVMWTSIASRLVSTCCFILPRMLSESGVRALDLARQAVARPIAASIPTACLAVLEYAALDGRIPDFWLLALAGTSCSGTYLACSLVWTLDASERAKIPYLNLILKHKNK